MGRHFNTAGPCLAEKHYMLPAAARLTQIRSLIDEEKFFVIHAPRQTGKTTLLRNLARELTAEGAFAGFAVSLESYTGEDPDAMIPQMLHGFCYEASHSLPEDLRPPAPEQFSQAPRTALRSFLGTWAASIPRPLVVFFDEIDSIPGPVLIQVLRQLRDGYTARPAAFPQSLALVGLKDVRDYRVLRDIRSDQDTLGTASPFNIKDRSLTLRNFTEGEVHDLLQQHTDATGQRFEDDAIAEIFHQTQGQPWLVNALAAQLTTSYDALVEDRAEPVTKDHVREARELLIQRRDTHLDSLVDKLREDRIKRVVQPILTGATGFDESYNDDFRYASDLGLVAVRDGVQTIANPIYAEIIPRVLTFSLQTSIAEDPPFYVAPDGTLDLLKLIGGFVTFWQRHGEVLLRGMPYQEAAPHLVFMAYLQRIINGGGGVDREFAVGTGRADLVVSFGGREDVIELKLLRGKWTVPEGLDQVARYAKKLGRPVGYLVVFDLQSKTPFEDRGEIEELTHQGVQVVLLRA
jgi:hypothetical protein